MAALFQTTQFCTSYLSLEGLSSKHAVTSSQCRLTFYDREILSPPPLPRVGAAPPRAVCPPARASVSSPTHRRTGVRRARSPINPTRPHASGGRHPPSAERSLRALPPRREQRAAFLSVRQAYVRTLPFPSMPDSFSLAVFLVSTTATHLRGRAIVIYAPSFKTTFIRASAEADVVGILPDRSDSIRCH